MKFGRTCTEEQTGERVEDLAHGRRFPARGEDELVGEQLDQAGVEEDAGRRRIENALNDERGGGLGIVGRPDLARRQRASGSGTTYAEPDGDADGRADGVCGVSAVAAPASQRT